MLKRPTGLYPEKLGLTDIRSFSSLSKVIQGFTERPGFTGQNVILEVIWCPLATFLDTLDHFFFQSHLYASKCKGH